MARTKKSERLALTQEQIATLLALLTQAGATVPAPAQEARKARKVATPAGDVVASAGGFTFAWTREKVTNKGAVQYRLVITSGSKTITRNTGYPYAVREENGTLAERVAGMGVPKFALSLAKSLAKQAA